MVTSVNDLIKRKKMEVEKLEHAKADGSLEQFINHYQAHNVNVTPNQVVMLGEPVFDSKVRVNTKAKAAPSVRKTIFQYENSSGGRGTKDYLAVANEFIERISAMESENLEAVVNG